MGAQFTKHFCERMEKIIDEELVEYPRQTGTEALAWARDRLNKISSSVTIDDIEKARDTITKTVLYAGEGPMYRSAVAVTQRLRFVAMAMQERKSANTGAIVEGLSWASPETSVGSPPVVETAPDPEQDWLYLYDGRSQWIQIGSSDPANISGGSREIHLGNVRIHTDGGKLVAVEIMDEPSEQGL